MRRSTGATGYIGGDALHRLTEAHADFEITCLVRDAERGAILTQRYLDIRLVYGSLDDFDLIAEEAFKADIVCNWASCEHPGCVKAILQGLGRKSAGQPGYLIHTSGSDILCFPDTEADAYGIRRDKVWDDVDDIQEIKSIKDTASHQEVDMAVLRADHSIVKTAVVCPPTIYGLGRGAGNTRSIQIPALVEYTLKRGSGLSVENGENIWSTIHIHDLSNLYLALIEDAAAGGAAATWGEEGYYFAENGEASWGNIAQAVAAAAKAKGYIASTEVQKLDAKTADEVWEYATLFWGTNSRCKAARARGVLKWPPKGSSVHQEISRLVTAEAKLLS